MSRGRISTMPKEKNQENDTMPLTKYDSRGLPYLAGPSQVSPSN